MNLEQSILKRFGPRIFDEEGSKIFDSHIRKALPFCDEYQSLIGTIPKEVLPNIALVYDLGCICRKG